MSRSRFELSFGSGMIIFNPPLIHWIVNTPSPKTRERLGPPQFFQGQRADHLTIPLEPLRHGWAAGKLNVHLTYTRPYQHRHSVAAVALQDIEGAFESFARALWEHFLQAVRLVTLDELDEDGCIAVIPNEGHFHAWIDQHVSRRKLRLTDENIEQLFSSDLADAYKVSILADLQDAPELQPVFLHRCRDDATVVVGYYPNGLGPTRPPGWYVLPIEDDFENVFERVFIGERSPAFFEAFLDIARELQADVDIDAIEAGLGRARARAVTQSG